MSYFSNMFNTQIQLFDADSEYPKGSFVKYGDYIYIAVKDNGKNVLPSFKQTDDNWEFLDPDSSSNVLVNLGTGTNNYPVSIGTPDLPFYGSYFMNSVNLTTKNKTHTTGFMSTLRFGRDMADAGSTTNINVLYDEDYQNPSLVGETQWLKEITLGNGLHRFKDIYTSSSPITLSDRNNARWVLDLDVDKYMKFFSMLRPVEYVLSSYHGGTSSRSHIGFLAEDVEHALEACNLDATDFAGLVKIPIYKKDVYKDVEFNGVYNKHCHIENGLEVLNTEYNYKQYLVGDNCIRYVRLPFYKQKLGYIIIKNYPLSYYDGNNSAEDLDITIHSMKLIPYDSRADEVELDFSRLQLNAESGKKFDGDKCTYELTTDNTLKIHYDKAAEYGQMRIPLSEDLIDADLSDYEYIRVVADYKQPFLIGFSDVQSIKEYDETYVDYQVSEAGDMYSYAQDSQYEILDYVYALRYEEFIALNTMMMHLQSEKLNAIETRLAELESKLGD